MGDSRQHKLTYRRRTAVATDPMARGRVEGRTCRYQRLAWRIVSPDDYRAGLHAWIKRASSIPGCLWRDGIQLKLHGQTFKSVGLSYYGNDRENPRSVTLELKESSVRQDGVGYDFDNPTARFTLKDDEIDVLRSFLNDKFTEDGYYVRADSAEMASEVKRQLSEFSPEKVAEVLQAVSDKLDLVRAIESTGHANFLADHLTAERKRQAIADLEAAVRDPNSVEQRFQAIIETHPWLFGGQYVATRPERMIVLGDQFDVPLVTADGSIHVVELKRANIPNLAKTYRNHLMVGQPVHEAVSQSANYLRSADENVPGIDYNFGIDARRVSATVVIGHIDYNTEEMTEKAFYQTLRTYNGHLSRIEVMTYDQLISSALNALRMAGSSDVGSDESVVETEPEPESVATTETTAAADDPWGPATPSTFSPVASTDDPWGSPPSGSSGASNDPFGSGADPDDEPPF
jgi:hypothetical protein